MFPICEVACEWKSQKKQWRGANDGVYILWTTVSPYPYFPFALIHLRSAFLSGLQSQGISLIGHLWTTGVRLWSPFVLWMGKCACTGHLNPSAFHFKAQRLANEACSSHFFCYWGNRGSAFMGFYLIRQRRWNGYSETLECCIFLDVWLYFLLSVHHKIKTPRIIGIISLITRVNGRCVKFSLAFKYPYFKFVVGIVWLAGAF